jgi:hypothetical protein
MACFNFISVLDVLDPDPDPPCYAFIWLFWIWIRIRNADPDPEALNLTKIYKFCLSNSFYLRMCSVYVCYLGGFYFSNLMGIKRRMLDIGKKIICI